MRVQGRGVLGWLAIAALTLTGLPALQGCGAGSADGGGGGTSSYQIGGTVSGLAGGGLVLQNNGGDDLMISANGSFSFPTSIASGAGYSATVKTQPSGPAQTCTVDGGSGTVASANVSAVTVVCATNRYQVAGTVSGLAGTGLVLKNNGADDLSISANGTFSFPVPVASGSTYAVTVGTQPTGPAQVCSVSGGSGPIGSAGVTGVAVVCSTSNFTVGGTVSGLNGSGLVLQNNGTNDLAIGASGSFVFTAAVADGAGYAVTVKTHASSPTQYCGVTNGTGTMAGANVTGVTVNCPVTVAVAAVAVGQNRMDVTWSAVGVSPLFTNIYRSPTAGSPGELIWTVDGASGTYRDSGLTQNTTYYYTVESVKSAGTGYWSAQASATTDMTPTFAFWVFSPSPVTGLTASRAGNVVTLTWDDYYFAGGWELYRTVDDQFPLGSQFTMTSSYGATFAKSTTDTIAGNGRYSYLLIVYEAGNTAVAASATVSIDVPAGTLPGIERPIFDFMACTPDASVLHVFWHGAPGAETHHVYAAPWVGTSPPAVITPSQGGTTPALDASTPKPIYQVRPGYYGLDIPYALLSNGDNAIAVEAVKGTYRSVGGGGNGFPKRAAAPVGVTGVRTARVNPTAIDVSWDAAVGAGSYKVYKLASATEVPSPVNLIGTTAGTSLRSTGLTPKTNYYYRVSAIAGGPGGGAESPYSDYSAMTSLSADAPFAWVPIILGMDQALLTWNGANGGTTFRIYGGAALVPSAIDPNNLVFSTTLDPVTGESPWMKVVGAPLATVVAVHLSGGVLQAFGRYWIEEVYPDGTVSPRTAFVMFTYL